MKSLEMCFAMLLMFGIIHITIISTIFNPDAITLRASRVLNPGSISFIKERNTGINGMKVTKITKTTKKANFIDFKSIRTWKMKEKIVDTKGCIDNSTKDLEWEHRTPYALIIGAQKAGSTAFYKYLAQHSDVFDTGRSEIHFYDVAFDTLNGPDIVTKEGIDREKAFLLYKRRLFSKGGSRKIMKDEPKKVIIDKTPGYLLFSDRIPDRVLCVTPWVKVLAILRNPVERAFSQYNMKRENDRNATITFEDWIERDIENLKRTGVLQDKIPLSIFRDSKMEYDAWKTYVRLYEDFPIGRGLYSIQIRQWIKAFEEAGRNMNDILVVKNEEMDKDPERVYNQTLDFLGLPQEHLKKPEKRNVGNYSSSLKESTRRMLEQLYAPYNEDLHELLGPEWVDTWD